MHKYCKIFLILARYNIARETEFRGNFLISVTISLLWIAVQLVVINIFFQFTNNIAGWSKAEVLALVGVYRIVMGFFTVFIFPNLIRLPEKINYGEFDSTLIKPVNPLYLESLSRQLINELGVVLIGVFIFIYAVVIGGLPVSFFSLVELVILAIFGFLVFYSIMLTVSMLSIFFTRLTALSSVYEILTGLIRYPTDILSAGSRNFELLVIPLALVITLPSKVFLGKVSLGSHFIELALPLVILFFAYRFWLFALRHYTSASS